MASKRRLDVVRLGFGAYPQASELQRLLLEKRAAGSIGTTLLKAFLGSASASPVTDPRLTAAVGRPFPGQGAAILEASQLSGLSSERLPWARHACRERELLPAFQVQQLRFATTDDGGFKGPPEVPPEQEKAIPEGTEDKRMWRKWIEQRLSQSGNAGDETAPSLSRSSEVEEPVTRFPDSGKRPKSLFAKSNLPEEDGKGPSVSGDSNTQNWFSPLDSIFKSALKTTSREERSFNRNSSAGNRRGPLFQESGKRPSFFSDRQVPSKPPRAPLDEVPVEVLDDFEYRVLGNTNDEDDSIDDDFLRDLDDIGRSARGLKDEDDDSLDAGEEDDWGDEKAKVLTDLALTNMEMFDLEDEDHPYRMRSDRLFFPGQTYDPEDLDLSKEAALEKPTVRTRKRYPSKEVFRVADFRNPRYLSKFIRESSRILPRRHYQISAKAQRKVAKEIKTARILGLMPFTSMGDPPFRFLRSRSEDDANGNFDED